MDQQAYLNVRLEHQAAERELGAFMSAVTELYGSEQARISAEDWIEEFESRDGLPGLTIREWRLITIAAAARLADRLIEVGHQATSMEEKVS
jgi:hypothetical protein